MDYNVRDVQFVQCSAFCNWYHPECEKYTDLDYWCGLFLLQKFQKLQKYILSIGPYDSIGIALLLLY